MENKQNPRGYPGDDGEIAEPVFSLKTVALVLGAYVLGVVLAVAVVPAWAPGLAQSLTGDSPKAYWYLARASAFAAYGLLWLSMVFGLLLTNKLSKAWPGGPAALDLHQYASLLGLGFGIFHALILLGDKYIGFTLTQILVPFSGASYQPFWVGLGQVGLYGMALVSLTFYARKWITQRGWRLVHFLSFAVMALSLFHGIKSGTDTNALWATAIYWISGAVILFLTVYRVLSSVLARKAVSIQTTEMGNGLAH